MKIHFERSGGFAGMLIQTELETTELSPQEAKEVESLVSESRFFQLPSRMSGKTGGADRFTYLIEIESEGKQHAVEVGESAVPEQLRPLVQRLEMLARRKRNTG